MSKARALPALVSLTTIAMIASNVAAAALPLFGRSTADVSARYPLLVTPTGITFSIWGVIFIAMLVYCGEQFVDPLASSPIPQRLAWPLIVSNVANVVWLVLWHSLQIYLTVPVMLVLLGALIVAYRRLGARRPASSRAETWAARAPISLYLGWVSFATVANIGVALYYAQWRGNPVSEPTVAVITLAVTVVLPLAALLLESNAIFAAVFVWAYVGVAFGQSDMLIVVTAVSLAVVVAVAMALTVFRRKRVV